MCIASIEKSRHVNGKLFLLTLKKGTGAKLVNVRWSASYILNVQLVISIAIIVILIQKYLGLQNRSFVFCNLDGKPTLRLISRLCCFWFRNYVFRKNTNTLAGNLSIHLDGYFVFFSISRKKVPRIQKVFFLFKGLLDLHFSIEMPLHRRAKYGY